MADEEAEDLEFVFACETYQPGQSRLSVGLDQLVSGDRRKLTFGSGVKVSNGHDSFEATLVDIDGDRYVLAFEDEQDEQGNWHEYSSEYRSSFYAGGRIAQYIKDEDLSKEEPKARTAVTAPLRALRVSTLTSTVLIGGLVALNAVWLLAGFWLVRTLALASEDTSPTAIVGSAAAVQLVNVIAFAWVVASFSHVVRIARTHRRVGVSEALSVGWSRLARTGVILLLPYLAVVAALMLFSTTADKAADLESGDLAGTGLVALGSTPAGMTGVGVAVMFILAATYAYSYLLSGVASGTPARPFLSSRKVWAYLLGLTVWILPPCALIAGVRHPAAILTGALLGLVLPVMYVSGLASMSESEQSKP